MSLLDQAAADLASIISDDVGGFAVPIRVVDPSGHAATINGLATDIGTTIDAETGLMTLGRKASITLPVAALRAAGLVDPVGISDEDQRKWKVTLKLPAMNDPQTFAVSRTAPDKLGCVVCFLEAYG